MTMKREETESLRLNIGGEQVKEGWKILNIVPGDRVDFIGDCSDLSLFSDASVTEIYASHVLEHLGYDQALPRALSEFHRVLRPQGRISISVPDLDVLCRLFVDPDLPAQLTLDQGGAIDTQFCLMQMMFGGRTTPHDIHYVGLTHKFLTFFLRQAGFVNLRRVEEHNLFEDASSLRFLGHLISLNMTAQKP